MTLRFQTICRIESRPLIGSDVTFTPRKRDGGDGMTFFGIETRLGIVGIGEIGGKEI